MAVAFLNISFSIFRRCISFCSALNSLRVTVSSSDTLIGDSCFTQLLSVLRFMPYSRSSFGYEVPQALYRSTICCLNSGVYDFWFFAMLNISFALSFAIIGCSTFRVHTYILTPIQVHDRGATGYSRETETRRTAVRHSEKAYRAIRHLFQVQGKEAADGNRANLIYDSEKLSQRRDERQDHNPDKGMENRVCQTDRREKNAESAISCIERGSKRSRANPKERLQYLTTGTAGTTAPQGAGYGAVKDRAARIVNICPATLY